MNDLLLQLVPGGLTPAWAAGLIAASVMTSAFTAAFGIGGGVAMIAVMLMVLPPTSVVPLHGVIQGGSNIGRVATMRAHVQPRLVGWFALGSVVGIVLGSLFVVSLPTRVLQIILGLFILWTLWFPALRKMDIGDRQFGWVGAGASFCTMFLGATGPLVGAFWNVARLGRQGVVANHAACMSIQHSLKVIAFAVLGFAFTEWIPFLLAMVGAGFVGTVLGARVLSRMPEKAFAYGFKGILTLLALRLLWSAAVGA